MTCNLNGRKVPISLICHSQSIILTLFCPKNNLISIFWGKNMLTIRFFSIIVCTFASK